MRSSRHRKGISRTWSREHEGALQAMRGRRRNPVKGMGWYRQVKRDFAELPDD